MHHKTLQQGDVPNYVHNMTFYAGETSNGRFEYASWSAPDVAKV